jgi:hypothetical protein
MRSLGLANFLENRREARDDFANRSRRSLAVMLTARSLAEAKRQVKSFAAQKIQL